MKKCHFCQRRKGSRKCPIVDELICSLCCGQTRSWSRCNTECQYFPQETLNYKPFNSQKVELTRISTGETTKFEVPLFLPNIFHQITCNVSSLTISILDFNKVMIKLDFQLIPDRNLGDELYNKDSWKAVTSNIPIRNGKPLAPLLIVATPVGGTSNLLSNSYKYGEATLSAVKTSYSLHVWLPYAKSSRGKVNVANLPEFDGDIIEAISHEGMMAFKKNDVFWGELHTKFEYSFNMALNLSDLPINDEGDILLCFGIFLPYKKVNIEKYKFFKSSEFDVSENTFLALQAFGNKKVDNLWETPLTQNFGNSFHGGHVKHMLSEINSPYHYDDFLYADYFIRLKSLKQVQCSLICESDNIVSAYFNCFKELYGGEYSPINLIVANLSSEIQKIKIEYEIKNYTNVTHDYIYLEPLKTVSIPLLPPLDDNALSLIIEHTLSHFSIKAYQNNTLIFEESKNFNLLPKETFVYDNEDVGKSKKLYFYSFLARWVTPNSQVIDLIINEASKNIKNLGEGSGGTIDDVMKELKTIYDTLSLHVKYVSRTFSLYKGETSLHQKVHLPESTFKNKSGNCIDLTVLMASCLEKIDYQPLLMIVPGHTYLGIKMLTYNIFIETTYLGDSSFENAVEQGNKNTERYFTIEFNPKEEKCIVVNVREARTHKIFPMN